VVQRDGWRLLSPRHAPPATLEGHLTFALKYEGVDLAILNALFRVIDPGAIDSIVRAKPTGRYARRVWFLYEWLTGTELSLPPLRRGSYVCALDPRLQYPGRAVNSPRHRVRNNLPGTPSFCPLVFRTRALEEFIASDLSSRARAAIAEIPERLRADVERVMALGEVMPDTKPIPFARREQLHGLLREAGRKPLDLNLIACLRGLSAAQRAELQPWLPSLIAGINAFEKRSAGFLDPVLAAACVGFGCAFGQPQASVPHPVQRYLIQHVLAARGFAPRGIILPVSAAACRLQADRGDLARAGYQQFFDATPHAEFLYACLQEVIEQWMPRIIAYIDCYERFREIASTKLGFPERPLVMLFERLRANDGRLPERLYAGSFPCMTHEKATQVEAAYGQIDTQKLASGTQTLDLTLNLD
jgi:hypothetical protein